MSAAEAGTLTLRITPIVVAECVYVLMGKHFQLNKEVIASLLTSFINLRGIETEEKEVIEKALTQFMKKGIDFADAYIAEHAKAVSPPHIVSVNVKDFEKLGIWVDSPNELMAKDQNS